MSKTSLSFLILAVTALLVISVCFTGCTTTPSQPATTTTTVTPAPTETGAKQKVLLATTTSLYDTGLLDYLKPKFEQMYNVDLLITSQGTGKAIELAKNGDADILMVHSPAQEKAFIDGGNGINPRCFAYNYFVIVGPANDPAGIRNMSPLDAMAKLRELGVKNTPGVMFASRGDNSGTHSAEKGLWSGAKFNYTNDIQKSGVWYIEAGRGMGETLQLANEKQAYTLSDIGTYLAYKGDLDLVPIVDQGDALLNRYTVMTVYNANQPAEKIDIANKFVDFMISQQTQSDIGNFGVAEYGQALFSPMDGQCARFSCDCTSPATATTA